MCGRNNLPIFRCVVGITYTYVPVCGRNNHTARANNFDASHPVSGSLCEDLQHKKYIEFRGKLD